MSRDKKTGIIREDSKATSEKGNVFETLKVLGIVFALCTFAWFFVLFMLKSVDIAADKTLEEAKALTNSTIEQGERLDSLREAVDDLSVLVRQKKANVVVSDPFCFEKEEYWSVIDDGLTHNKPLDGGIRAAYQGIILDNQLMWDASNIRLGFADFDLCGLPEFLVYDKTGVKVYKVNIQASTLEKCGELDFSAEVDFGLYLDKTTNAIVWLGVTEDYAKLIMHSSTEFTVETVYAFTYDEAQIYDNKNPISAKDAVEIRQVADNRFEKQAYAHAFVKSYSLTENRNKISVVSLLLNEYYA